jgi:hypothetical protein
MACLVLRDAVEGGHGAVVEERHRSRSRRLAAGDDAAQLPRSDARYRARLHACNASIRTPMSTTAYHASCSFANSIIASRCSVPTREEESTILVETSDGGGGAGAATAMVGCCFFGGGRTEAEEVELHRRSRRHGGQLRREGGFSQGWVLKACSV